MSPFSQLHFQKALPPVEIANRVAVNPRPMPRYESREKELQDVEVSIDQHLYVQSGKIEGAAIGIVASGSSSGSAPPFMDFISVDTENSAVDTAKQDGESLLFNA